MDTAIATARGVDGGDTGATTTDGQCFFQDRSHQYVETKGRRPGTEPNTNPFWKREKRKPGGCAKLPERTPPSLQRGESTVGTPALQPLTDNVFFRTEATNMLKQKDDALGPNPIRTHFGNGKNGSQEDAPSCLNGHRHRYSAGSRRWGHRRWTPALQPLTDNVFFRTEATNMLKQKDGTPGPNPIRTHFGKRRK